jgi:transaldolase
MRLFIDTGSVAEVEEISAWGVLSGATTNPTLLAREHADPGRTICRICDLVDGPVSAEVVATDAAGMIAQGLALSSLHEHVVVKVPFSPAGLEATSALAEQEIPVNMTLVFTASQALLAAEAGATFVSCFLGRLEDVSIDSGETLQGIIETLHTGQTTAEVLAASIRTPQHAVLAARLGAEIATVPGRVLHQMLAHPLTAAGIERFGADWASRPELGEWMTKLVDGEVVR